MIVLAGDSFTGWDQNVEKTWHVRIKNEYPNVVNIGKGGISNVDILKKIKTYDRTKCFFVINLSHLCRFPGKVLASINSDCNYVKNEKLAETYEVENLNIKATNKIIELVKDRSFIWTPFFGYEKWNEVNDFSKILSQHNEMFSPKKFKPVGNHLDQSGHDFIYKKVKEFLNGVN